MEVFRVGIRNAQGQKLMIEVNNTQSYAMARDFVIRETKAQVCLALVNPIEQTIFDEPEKILA